MHCPFCSAPETRVIDSRLFGEGEMVRRRRECCRCRERFTTYETAELAFPRIIKRDGRREVFKEDKLRAGMLRALEKRPVDMERVEVAITQIKRRLRASGEREVESRRLGDWVMEQLRGLDQVAYVRFASVYRQFEDVRAFLDEIERMERELPPQVRQNQLELLPGEQDGKTGAGKAVPRARSGRGPSAGAAPADKAPTDVGPAEAPTDAGPAEAPTDAGPAEAPAGRTAGTGRSTGAASE